MTNLAEKTILVVEDNDAVRGLCVRILKMQGYRVIEANHGVDALSICLARREPIDLILTDVTMPYMNGRELIERLKGVRDDFRVIYMSGYTDDVHLQQKIYENKVNFIPKPFNLPDLLQKVSEVLGTPPQWD